MVNERPKDCVSRTLSAGSAGGIFGGIAGALIASWRDVPKVIQNKSLPALQQTGRIMVAEGVFFAAIGGVYAATDCIAEELRGKHDAWNGVLGGFAAGSVSGLRTRRVGVAVGMGAVLAFTSAIVDITGHSFIGNGLFDDGATIKPTIFPYPTHSQASK